ncbi:hypothetical protein G4B88_009402 [Cannabis sativa]|uniref:CCHC-type domain-containing protein n=1 Tax=Cannabis sativa TaxID=3483 RepID=A0A7J6E5W9_CANSA|nr:hypothetical protein G4B88_009402 [Cannabis sativa]
MEVVNASLTPPPLKGKCLSVNDALVKLVPCESSRKALSTFCLLGKVVAPMSVSEAYVMEFVAKAWKFPVSVVALAEGSKHANWFELRFAREEDRSWALDHGPWCIRGYTFFLQVWSSTSDSPVLSDTMRIWVQVHNIPHEFFSMANGLLLGGKAGKVIYVDLKENDPASWGKYLKILIEKDFNSPLFSGCFFDLDSGVKRWLQFKYEQVGIFCYFCGRLGHQRRGCTLTSPELVTSDNGIPSPLFGPWLSTSSTYRDVFSSANSFSPCREYSGYALYAPFRRPSKVVALGHGDGGFRRTVSTISRGSRRSGMVTKRGVLSAGTVHRSEWVSKSKPAGVVPPPSKSGREREVGIAQMEKESELLPGIEPPITEAIEDRSLMIVPDLNLCAKNGGNYLVDRAQVEPISAGGPKVGFEPIGVNNLHKERLTINSFGDKRGDVGLIGPCVKDNGLISNHVDKIIRPKILDVNMGNNVSGPPLINNNPISCGPTLVETQVVSNLSQGSMGPVSLGVNDNSIGPINPSQANIGHVEATSILPNASHGVVDQVNEEQALTQFFNAQESLLYDLKHFGNLDLYEIRKIGGDIGVPASSEVNERTTPFKKRKFEVSASLCSRPHKIPRKYPEVVRDFPWDTKHQANASDLVIDDPSEDKHI